MVVGSEYERMGVLASRLDLSDEDRENFRSCSDLEKARFLALKLDVIDEAYHVFSKLSLKEKVGVLECLV